MLDQFLRGARLCGNPNRVLKKPRF
jgi:hypothetical protein